MFNSKYFRTILILIGALIVVAFFVLPFNRAAPTDAALAPPPPRTTATTPPPTSENGGSGGDADDDDDGDQTTLHAAIYGQVTDLSTGRPGQGLEVKINDSIVRTDSDGRYSLTGLDAGAYTAQLQLSGSASPAQEPLTVHLADQETVTVDLHYYSQPRPTPTPTETPAPTPTPPLVEAEPADDTLALNVSQDASAAFSPLTPATNGNPAVWINPGHINNEIGVTGNIALDVANVADLGAFQATLDFNPKIIEIEEVILGNFLDSTGRQTNPLVTEIDNTSGEISFVAYTSGDTAGPNGGGTLAVISFISKQAGISSLELNQVRLVARLGKAIEAQVGDGQISVTSCFGDLNDDQIVDISDVQAVAGRVGQALGDPNYVLEFDLNNDNLIGEEDLILITDRLYETCP